MQIFKYESRGTTIPGVTKKQLAELKFPLPPLNEQKRIVEKIEELFTKLDAGVEALKQVRTQIKRYRQAVLRDAVSGELTKVWRKERQNEETGEKLLKRILIERRELWEQDQLKKFEEKGKLPKDDKWKTKYKPPAEPDTENLPELPESWIWVTLETIASHRLGKMLDKKKNVGEESKYLRNINVRWFSFDLSNLFTLLLSEEERTELSIENGDLLICEGGEPGRCAVWKSGENNLVFQKAIHCVRVNQYVSPFWLGFAIKNDANSGTLEKYFTGSTIKHFTGRKLAVYEFPIPPLAEQEKIVEEVERLLSVADAVEQSVEDSLKQAERLRQSILKKAFEGNLVPQDNKDEPASILLEKIKAEREKEKKAKGKKNKAKSKKKKSKNKTTNQGNLPY